MCESGQQHGADAEIVGVARTQRRELHGGLAEELRANFVERGDVGQKRSRALEIGERDERTVADLPRLHDAFVESWLHAENPRQTLAVRRVEKRDLAGRRIDAE